MEIFIRENIFLVAFLLLGIVGWVYLYLFLNYGPVIKSLYRLSTGLAAWTLGIFFLFVHMIQPHRDVPFFIKIVCLIFGGLLLISTLIVFFGTRSIEKRNGKGKDDS